MITYTEKLLERTGAFENCLSKAVGLTLLWQPISYFQREAHNDARDTKNRITAHSEMRLWTDNDLAAVLAVNTNWFVDVWLLDVTWVRVLQHHHVTYNNNNTLLENVLVAIAAHASCSSCLIPSTSGSFIICNKHHTIHHFLSLPFQT